MVSTLPITSQKLNKNLPVHVYIHAGEVDGLYKDSVVLTESGWTLNKTQLIRKIGVVPEDILDKVADCLMTQMPSIRRKLIKNMMREGVNSIERQRCVV
jgi:mRNA-degrading endonuclease toxin of MazEF toxin-antitoxin module